MTTNDERLQKACGDLEINLDELQMQFARGVGTPLDLGIFIESGNAGGEMFVEAAGDDDKLDDLIIARMEKQLDSK